MKFLKEAKQAGTLYHITTIEGLDLILQTDTLKGSRYSGISFTRDKNLNKFDGAPPRAFIKLIIDGDALSNNYKITPKDATNWDGDVPVGYQRVILTYEHEEYVKGSIKNISKYIKGIILIDDELLYDFKYMMDENPAYVADDKLFRHGNTKRYTYKDVREILKVAADRFPIYAQHGNKTDQDFSGFKTLNLM